MYRHSTRKIATAAFLVLALAAVLYGTAREAREARTFPVDEPLWFMRATEATPADVSTDDYRFWAIDVPAVNRWIWGAVLKATNLDKVPAGEPRVWSIRDTPNGKRLFAYDTVWRFTPGFPMTEAALAERDKAQGAFAPRCAVMAMRYTNVAAYGLAIIGLWLAGYVASRSVWTATAAAAPLVMLPLASGSFVWRCGSGDIYLLNALIWGLALWLWLHVRGKAVSWKAAVVLGFMAGLAVSAKQTGVLLALALAAYYAITSRGRGRAILPAVVLATAFAAFVMVNPVVFIGGEWPWTVCMEMIARRASFAAGRSAQQGGLGLNRLFAEALWWWPALPALAVGLWHARREPWALPVALWAGVTSTGTVLGLMQFGYIHEAYLVPLEMAVFFPAALLMAAKFKTSEARQGEVVA